MRTMTGFTLSITTLSPVLFGSGRRWPRTKEVERARYGGAEFDTDEFWDGKRLAYDRLFGQDFVASRLHVGTVRDARVRNEPDGSNFTTLSNLCVIAVYDFWNDYLRREYCRAKGYGGNHKELREHASFDLWGDIRHLRNSIVHNRGVATEEVRRSKVIKWFQPGDQISISPERMRGVFHALYGFRNELHAESLKKTVIKVPIGRAHVS